MPGNVANADVGSPPRVMPDNLSRQFTEVRDQLGIDNPATADGRSVRAAIATNSRKTFQREVACNTVAAALMEVYFEANRHHAFYVYFFPEGAHDPTGVSTAGRYAMRFVPEFERVTEIGKMALRFSITEVL